VRPLIDRAIDAVLAETPKPSAPASPPNSPSCRSSSAASSSPPPSPTGEPRKEGQGQRRPVLDHRQSLHLQGLRLCVTVCEDDALKMVTQTEDSVERLRRDWNFWLDLPTTPKDYSRIDSLDEKIGALETLLLDKRNYGSMNCGDGACLGCGEKTAIHLFTSTVTALMQPRVKPPSSRSSTT
jgi:pyruvate-ferredoxin/flavodoxin oxidoreductase